MNNLEKDPRFVDIHDEQALKELGIIRHPLVKPRDKSVWTKTKAEKDKLRKLRRQNKQDMHFNEFPIKRINCYSKLTIRLRKNHKFPKSTYSTECWQHEIPAVLANYVGYSKKDGVYSLVKSYSYNGFTYKMDDVQV
jgi:hypothetical protein